jgi:hypothetical protein
MNRIKSNIISFLALLLVVTSEIFPEIKLLIGNSDPLYIAAGFTGLAIGGIEGNSVLGKSTLSLGPAQVLYGNANNPVVAGVTFTSTSGSTAVTGTGFTTLNGIVPGAWLLPTTGTALVQVAVVTSATAIVLASAATQTLTAVTVRIADVLDLGGTTKTSFKFGLTKAELKESQSGDTAADRAVTGYNSSIEIELTRATIARIQKVTQGVQIVRDALTGAIKGFGFGLPIGETDLDISKQLYITLYSGGAISTNPLDQITFLKVAPMTEAELMYDASGQRVYKTTFNAYIDPTTVLNGVPQIFTVGAIV